MKRIHIMESIRKVTETSPKELVGLHGLVFQVAFGLLLAFYNQEMYMYLCYSLETNDVEVRQYSLAYWQFHAITFEHITFTNITILKIKPVWH